MCTFITCHWCSGSEVRYLLCLISCFSLPPQVRVDTDFWIYILIGRKYWIWCLSLCEFSPDRPFTLRERRPLQHFQCAWLWAVFSLSFQEWPLLCSLPWCPCTMSFWIFLSLCGFHVRACLLMLLVGFLRMWPIHLHFLLIICVASGSWFALLYRSLLLVFSGW